MEKQKCNLKESVLPQAQLSDDHYCSQQAKNNRRKAK